MKVYVVSWRVRAVRFELYAHRCTSDVTYLRPHGRCLLLSESRPFLCELDKFEGNVRDIILHRTVLVRYRAKAVLWEGMWCTWINYSPDLAKYCNVFSVSSSAPLLYWGHHSKPGTDYRSGHCCVSWITVTFYMTRLLFCFIRCPKSLRVPDEASQWNTAVCRLRKMVFK